MECPEKSPRTFSPRVFDVSAKRVLGGLSPIRGGGDGDNRLGAVSDSGCTLCFSVRDLAHELLHKAYRKELDQLSTRKYLQTVMAQGAG